MTCRRCNTDRNVGHYSNDILDGWFCIYCVDQLCDAFVAKVMREVPVHKAAHHV